MQHLSLICVGRLGQPFLQQGCAEYLKRLGGFCRLRLVELPEEPLREKRPGPAEIGRVLKKEGARILEALPRGGAVAALCIEGRSLSSEELAALLAGQAAGPGGELAFVIGSSHGLCEEVKARADWRISMGRMTFPHQLARLMLLEQLYRACSINAGGQYHK